MGPKYQRPEVVRRFSHSQFASPRRHIGAKLATTQVRFLGPEEMPAARTCRSQGGLAWVCATASWRIGSTEEIT